jgi:hypothetical protein
VLHQFFDNLIGTKQPRSCSLNFANLNLPTADLAELEAPILEEEVKAAVFDLHPEKAPGPDGFTCLFYRRCWNIIKTDLMAAITQFESLVCRNLHILNNATMILLPKSPDAFEPKDFRPISLVCSFAKLVLKILA